MKQGCNPEGRTLPILSITNQFWKIYESCIILLRGKANTFHVYSISNNEWWWTKIFRSPRYINQFGAFFLKAIPETKTICIQWHGRMQIRCGMRDPLAAPPGPGPRLARGAHVTPNQDLMSIKFNAARPPLRSDDRKNYIHSDIGRQAAPGSDRAQPDVGDEPEGSHDYVTISETT